MAEVQSIPNTNLPKGTHTFSFTPSTAVWNDALVVIDRTVNNGLNSLTNADTLGLDIQYSLDGGITWNDLAGATFQGGLITVKGVTLSQEILECATAAPFPTGTNFQVITTASTRVFVAGTVTYTSSGT